MTVRDALDRARARLTRAAVPDAAWDAERLLCHALGWDRAALVAGDGQTLTAGAQEQFEGLIEQRALRRPLQHLTGRQAFWRHEFAVGPDVLIPRPETELLVEAALDRIRGVVRPVLADVGTGSGCIALSLAAERPDAEVHATELSAPALAVAAENARRLGLESRVQFHQGDLLGPVAAVPARLGLVVSNPPYVDASEWPQLQPEVRDHEPTLALTPAGDRYTVYRRLAPQAARLLEPGGFLLLELGLGMREEVARICAATGLEVQQTLADLQSIPRCLVARRPLV